MRDARLQLSLASATRLVGILASTTLLFFFGRLLLEVLSDSPTVAESSKVQSEALLAAIEQARPKGAILQIAVDPSCVPCEKSFPFYRSLVATKVSKDFFVEALVEIPLAMAYKYLEGEELTVDQVRQIKFKEAGFIGTPSLRILDEQRNVLQKWTGSLSAQQQKEVAFLLGVQREFNASSADVSTQKALRVGGQSHSVSLSSEEIRTILQRDPAVVVLDVRPRTHYANVHIRDAINIPQDELSVRASNELDYESQIVVYCLSNEKSCSKNDVAATSSDCLRAVFALREAGFKNVRLIAATLDELNTTNEVEMDSSERVHLPRIVLAENLL